MTGLRGQAPERCRSARPRVKSSGPRRVPPKSSATRNRCSRRALRGACQVVAQVGPHLHPSQPCAATTREWSWPNHPCPRRALANGHERSRAVNHGSCRSALTSQFGVGAGPSLALDSAFQARDIGATSHRKITDNSGYWRSTDPAAQPSLSVIIAGRPTSSTLSRTEGAKLKAGPGNGRAGKVSLALPRGTLQA
jgi:hypothetical protein